MIKNLLKNIFFHKNSDKSEKIVNRYFVNNKIDNYLDKLEDLYSIMKYYIEYNNTNKAIDTYKSIINFRNKTEPYIYSFNRHQKFIYNDLQIRFKEYIDKIEKILG